MLEVFLLWSYSDLTFAWDAASCHQLFKRLMLCPQQRSEQAPAMCMWKMNHFHLIIWFIFVLFFLAPDGWVGFCNLLRPVITRVTELVTTQDLGRCGGRKGYFTLPAISLLICLFMLRTLTTAERGVWALGSGLSQILLLMEAQRQLLSQTRPNANPNSQSQKF